MICSPVTHNNITAIFTYHFNKIASGQATIISTNGIETSRNDLITNYKYLLSLNPKVTKQLIKDFPLSFNPKETISSKKAIEIAEQYLKRMGYENTAFTIIRHYDKKHQHIHIITPTVDFTGKKINSFNEMYTSKQVCRELELEFNLIETSNSKTTDYRTLKSINAEKYLFENSLKKAQKDKKFTDIEIPSKGNDEVFYIKKYGKERVEEIKSYLILHKYMELTDKLKLERKLQELYDKGLRADEYIKEIQKAGYYARSFKTSGKEKIVYGIKSEKTETFSYFKDSDLNKKFDYKNIYRTVNQQQTQNSKQQFDDVKQKQYMKNIINRCLYNSKNWKEFEQLLKTKNIELIYNRKEGVVHGVSFMQNNISNAIAFFGSQIDKQLSYSKINQRFEKTHNLKPTSVNPQIQSNNKSQLPKTPTISTHIKPPTTINPTKLGKAVITDDDAERRRKKKKKDEDKDVSL